MTSSENLAAPETQISLMPLPMAVVTSFLALGVVLSVFRGLFALYPEKQHGESDAERFWNGFFRSLFQFYAVYVKQPLPLGLREIKKWERSSIAILWMFSSVIFCGIYTAYFTTHFFPKISLPFSNTLELAELLLAQKFRMVTPSFDSAFLMQTRESNASINRRLRKSFQVNPPLLHPKPMELLRQHHKARFKFYATNACPEKYTRAHCVLHSSPPLPESPM